MKSLRHLIASALLTGLSLGAAAEDYVVRMPVSSAVHTAVTSSFEFGTVIVGTQPQKVFTFTNRGSTPTTLGTVQASGKAKVFSHTCTGVLQPNASCSLTLGVVVDAVGLDAGAVAVSHSSSTTADIYNLSANGVAGSSVLRFDESLLNFGDQPLRTPSDARTLTLRNSGSMPAVVAEFGFSRSTVHFSLLDNTCEGKVLAPSQTCTLQTRFTPQSLGPVSATVSFALEDGTLVNAATLSGVGVQGVASWSAQQVNFVGVPAGQTSPTQALTLTNTGKGPLGLTSMTVLSGSDSNYFKIESTTCPATLLPGLGCAVNVSFTAPDTTVRSATLQLETSGTATAISRVQLFGQPVAYQALLTVEPASLSFGDQPVGVAQSLSLTLKSTGQLPVAVSGYTLTGAAAADFRLLNAATCTGTLSPGMQCALQVEAKPTVAGARAAYLNVGSNANVAVGAVPMSVNGLPATLEVTPAALTFDPLDVGANAQKTLVLKNTGSASLKVNSVALSGAQASMFAASSNCSGQTLAAAASCTVTVTYAPTAAAGHSATLTVASSAQNGSVAVPLNGTANPPPAPVLTLSDFTCPTPARTGQVFTCSATLANPGTVAATYSGNGTSSLNAFTPAVVGCSSPVLPGKSCTVTLQANIALEGVFTTNYSLPTSAGTLAKSVSVKVEAPRAALSMGAHPATLVGQTSTATHTLTNTGSFPLTLTLPATFGSTATGTVFGLQGTTCTASLAVGQSCDVVTRCTPAAVATYANTLQVKGGLPAVLSGALSCVGQGAPGNNSQWLLTPSTIGFGSIKVGQATTPTLVTIKNNSSLGTAPMTLTDLRLVGSNANVFTVDKGACLKSYSPGQTCQITVTAKPDGQGARTGAVELVTSASGTAPQVALSVTGVDASFTATPTTLDFGTRTAGIYAEAQVTLTNVGPVAGTVAVALGTSNSAAFSVPTLPCNNLSLASKYQCATKVTLPVAATQNLRGLQRGNMTFSFANGQAPITVDFTVNLTEPPVPQAKLDFACPATGYVGTPVPCSTQVTSTGTGPLTVSSLTVVSAAAGVPNATVPATKTVCTQAGGTLASITPGNSCTVTHVFTPAMAKTYTLTASGNGNTALTPASASIVVSGPSLGLVTQNHPDTQAGTFTTATHVLTNTGLGAVTVTTAYSSVPAMTVNKTGCTTLASGQSCTLTTSFAPSAAGNVDAVLTVNGTPLSSATGHVLATAVAPRVSVAYEQPLTTDAGGYSASGNWVRMTNAGVGPVTLQSFAPAAGWALFGSTANSAQCVAGKTLQPGTSCLLAEALLGNQAPGTTATGSQRIRTSAGDLTWTASPIRLLGLRFVAESEFGTPQVGDDKAVVYRVYNDAPVATSAGISFTASGFGLSVVGNTCASSVAPGAYCTVTLRYVAGLTPVTFTGAVSATAGYDAVFAKQPQTGTAKPAVQAKLSLAFKTVAANVNLAVGTNSPIHVGQTVDITHVLSNDGSSAVKLTGAPSLVGAQHTLVGGTCALNGILAPGQSCTIVTRFAPTTAYQSAATVSINTSVGPKSGSFVGKVVPATDVSVSVGTASRTMLVGGSATYSLAVANTTMGPARVNVSVGSSVAGGARSYVSQFAGGICGTYTFNDAGAIVSQGPATAAALGGPTCTPRVASGQIELLIPANRSYTGTLTVQAGPNVGSVTVAASAAVSEVDDTNAANNSSSATTEVTYPISDMAISFDSVKSVYGIEGGETVMATVRTAGNVKDVASGRVSFSASSLSGNASLGIASITCVSKTAGATCDDSGNVSLPGGGSARFAVQVNFGSAVGQAQLLGNVVMTTTTLTDTPLTNNTAKVVFKLDAIPSEKWCTFTNPPGTVGINEGLKWAASEGPFRNNSYMQGKYSPYIGAAEWYLWQVAYSDNATGKVYWRGTNKPVADQVGNQLTVGKYSPSVSNVFYPRVLAQSNMAGLQYADGNLSSVSYSGSAIFRLPGSYPESYMNSPGIKDQSDYNSYGALRYTLGDSRVFNASWVATFNSLIGRGAPYSPNSACYGRGQAFYDYPSYCFWGGYQVTGAADGKQVAWREYSIGGSCGASNARRIR